MTRPRLRRSIVVLPLLLAWPGTSPEKTAVSIERVAVTPFAQALPTPAPEGLIFAGEDRGRADMDIVSMRSDGSGRMRLTDGILEDSVTALSPDRTKLLSSKSSGATFDGDVYRMNINGTHVKRLTRTRTGAGSASWARGMRRIVYSRLFRGGVSGINAEIYVMKANGENDRRLTRNNVIDYQPVWSRDGRIIFVRSRGNQYNIMSMRPDGSDVTRLTSTAALEFSPDISPDGSQIIFTRREAEGTTESLVVMNLEGLGERTLISSEFPLNQPAWSADGRQIIFIGGGFQIYRMNTDGSELVQVTDGDSEYFSVEW